MVLGGVEVVAAEDGHAPIVVGACHDAAEQGWVDAGCEVDVGVRWLGGWSWHSLWEGVGVVVDDVVVDSVGGRRVLVSEVC